MDIDEAPHADNANPYEMGGRVAAAAERLAVLTEARNALIGHLDVEATVEMVARLAVPRLADWCFVDLVVSPTAGEPHRIGALRRVAIGHAEPALLARAWTIARRPPPVESPGPVTEPAGAGGSGLMPSLTDRDLAALARHPAEVDFLRTLGLRSALATPLVARDRLLGILTLATAESGRRLGPDDLATAEDVACLVALAIDNARLFWEARAAVRDRDRFLAIAAHELRTPVAGIKGYAQMLLRANERGRLTPNRLAKGLASIDRSTTHLAILTDDLLDVSRLRLGQLPLRPVRLALGPLVEEVVDRAAASRGLARRPEIAVEPGLPLVLADPARIEQVVTNLVDNAVAYSPKSGSIRIALRADGGGIAVEVTDEGIGLPSGAEAVIFEPFGRADNAVRRGLPGLGLGLHICRGVVERHGGRLWARSAGEDRGTTVGFWLPAAESRVESREYDGPRMTPCRMTSRPLTVIPSDSEESASE